MNDPWILALERAAGRGSPGTRLPAPVLAWARRVVEAGRRVHAQPPCPSAVLRRALAIPDEVPLRGKRPLAALWRVLFDSALEPLAAQRGGLTGRLLHLAGEGGSMDLDLAVGAGGEVRLRGTVDGARPGLVLRVEPARGPRVDVAVRAGGAFEANLPKGSVPVRLSLRSRGKPLARTPPLPPGA